MYLGATVDVYHGLFIDSVPTTSACAKIFGGGPAAGAGAVEGAPGG